MEGGGDGNVKDQTVATGCEGGREGGRKRVRDGPDSNEAGSSEQGPGRGRFPG